MSRAWWVGVLMLLTSCAATGPQASVITTSNVAVTPAPASTAPATDAASTSSLEAETSTAATQPGQAGKKGPCTGAADASTRYDHVVWVWMENKNTAAVSRPATAPYLTSLAAACASATDFVDHGLHPSLPNYIAATAGDPLGITDDDPPSAHPLAADNIFRQVRATGGRAISYEESMTGACALHSTHLYAVKHNPAAYFSDPGDRDACQHDDVPFDQFARDLAAGALPDFALITPNICHDMHSCSVAMGDQWLRQTISGITDSPVYAQGRTIVFITFDESKGSGTMPFFAIAPGVRPGTVATTELDHYALLAFTEDALGIRNHLGRAVGAPDLASSLGLPSA